MKKKIITLLIVGILLIPYMVFSQGSQGVKSNITTFKNESSKWIGNKIMGDVDQQTYNPSNTLRFWNGTNTAITALTAVILDTAGILVVDSDSGATLTLSDALVDSNGYFNLMVQCVGMADSTGNGAAGKTRDTTVVTITGSGYNTGTYSEVFHIYNDTEVAHDSLTQYTSVFLWDTVASVVASNMDGQGQRITVKATPFRQVVHGTAAQANPLFLGIAQEAIAVNSYGNIMLDGFVSLVTVDTLANSDGTIGANFNGSVTTAGTVTPTIPDSARIGVFLEPTYVRDKNNIKRVIIK